jgi:hypothetical protein
MDAAVPSVVQKETEDAHESSRPVADAILYCCDLGTLWRCAK